MERRKFIDKDEYITRGSEGEIWKVQDGLYKKFTREVKLPVRLRKEKLLLYLEKLEHLKKHYPNIKYIVDSLLGLCMLGYVMEPVDRVLLSTEYFELEQVIELLGKLRAVLEEFKKEGLYYFDIRYANVRVQDGEPVLLDIDSMITAETKKLDVLPTLLEPYLYRGGKIDEHAQIVMFNQFSLHALGTSDWYLEHDPMAWEILKAKKSGKIYDSAWDHEYFYEHIKVRKI